MIIFAAEQTCAACSLRESALKGKLAVCRACPAVELLRRMVAHG